MTVVETNIHYPTESSLLGDGARVLTRTMKKIETEAGRLKRKVRNRTRSVSTRELQAQSFRFIEHPSKRLPRGVGQSEWHRSSLPAHRRYNKSVVRAGYHFRKAGPIPKSLEVHAAQS